MTTRLTAPAKLTVSLRVTGVRADGLHTIDAEMVSISLADELTVDDGDSLEVIGPHRAGVPTDDSNLVRRALAELGRTARVRLTKNVPAQAGLGGGSSDAAAILRWAGVSDLELAARLGADVPFCLIGGRARVGGFGEIVEPMDFEPATYTLLSPPSGCDTAAVYAAFDRVGAGGEPNDLTRAALTVAPELAESRDRLGELSGQEPRLAGSGSTWFVSGEHEGPALRVVEAVPAPAD